MSRRLYKLIGCWTALISLCGFLGGCSYGSIQSAQRATRDGYPGYALEELGARAQDGFGGPHQALGWLEYGAALYESGHHRRSSEAFLRAEDAFDAQDLRPRTSLSEEFAAAATNPLVVAYRGSANERVLAPTYRAMNALLVGDRDAARSALNEAAYRQDQALERRSKQVEEAKLARGGASRFDVGRSVDRAIGPASEAARLDELARFGPYRDFVNPFTELLHAVFRLAAAEDVSDGERAHALMRSVAGMVPDNPHVIAALDSAQRAAGGDPEFGVTHVFFATGFGPGREPVRIDLPLFTVNDAVDYVGVSFPRLFFDDAFDRALDVTGADGTARTEVVADMDRMVAVEFREEFPTLLTRAIIGAAAKAAAAYGINEATKSNERDGDDTVNILARVLAGLYLVSQNQADTRAWVTIPKQFQYARVRTPQDGVVRIQTSGAAPGSVPAEVRVDPEGVSLVFVRSMRPGLPLRVEPVVFRPIGSSEPSAAVGGKDPRSGSEEMAEATSR